MQYEYKVVVKSLEMTYFLKQINELGRQEWRIIRWMDEWQAFLMEREIA